MGRSIDLTGHKYNFLTVISKAGKQGRISTWNCVCDCGNKSIVQGGNLRNGGTKSCGCHNRDKMITHGMSYKPIYAIWQAMIKRCTKPNDKNYKYYGGRGIAVCDRWLESFENFYDDMGDRPDGLSLDRRDNNKGYSKSNCRWATASQQCINQRISKSNKSGKKGVSKATGGKWAANITVEGNRYQLGEYSNFKDACNARDKGELKYHSHLKK